MVNKKSILSPTALLFDCDGTITDEHFLPNITSKTIEEIYTKHGYSYSHETFEKVFETHKGGGFDKYYLEYLKATGHEELLDEVSAAEYVDLNIKNYIETADRIANGDSAGFKLKINKGVVEIMRWANQNRVPVAIVTNANPEIVRANLKIAGICVPDDDTIGKIKGPKAYANIIVDRSDYGLGAVLRKPNPYPYKYACDLLGVNIEDAIGFEDSANGHLSLYNAGVGVRVHVCHEKPEEPLVFFNGDERFGPDVVAFYGTMHERFVVDVMSGDRNGLNGEFAYKAKHGFGSNDLGFDHRDPGSSASLE